MIVKLPCRALSNVQDRAYANKLIKNTKKSHPLVIYPNAWMEGFGIRDEQDIKQVNEAIVAILKEYEDAARARRKKKGQNTKGANKLKTEINKKTSTDIRTSKLLIYPPFLSPKKCLLVNFYYELLNDLNNSFLRLKNTKERAESKDVN